MAKLVLSDEALAKLPSSPPREITYDQPDGMSFSRGVERGAAFEMLTNSWHTIQTVLWTVVPYGNLLRRGMQAVA
jgi:hypothetical protein